VVEGSLFVEGQRGKRGGKRKRSTSLKERKRRRRREVEG